MNNSTKLKIIYYFTNVLNVLIVVLAFKYNFNADLLIILLITSAFINITVNGFIKDEESLSKKNIFISLIFGIISIAMTILLLIAENQKYITSTSFLLLLIFPFLLFIFHDIIIKILESFLKKNHLSNDTTTSVNDSDLRDN